MRRISALAACLALAACDSSLTTKPQTGGLDVKALQRAVSRIADQARPARLGVAVLDVANGDVFAFDADRPYPMQSVFKAMLGAAALAQVDAGRLSLDETITLKDTDLSPPYSPIADAWPQRTTYTFGELLEAAAGGSDNTAADILMRRIGGPSAVTVWLRQKGIDDIRIDRFERELQTEVVGLASFRPQWKGETAFMQALTAVPQDQRRAATAAYLADPRDTATPRAAASFLVKLAQGSLLSPASTRRLLDIMTRSPTGRGRLRAAATDGVSVAHKTGAARTDLGLNPASNDIGVYTLKDGRKLAVAVFLAASPADDAQRDAVIAGVGRAAVAAAR